MPSSILIFAGPQDDEALRDHAESIGLQLLHPFAAKMSGAEVTAAFENVSQGGFFSFLPLPQLHPLEQRGGVLCKVVDPLLPYVRPHYAPPYLIAGQVRWNNDVQKLADQTRPYFRKLRRWVQKNWRRRDEDRYYIGPDAERILQKESVRIAYMPPGVDVQTRVID